MSRANALCGALIFLMVPTGCGTSPLAMTWPASRPFAAEYPVVRHVTVADEIAAAPATSGMLTLNQALALSLTHHPALAAAAWEVEARHALALQAGLGPNPELGLEVENFAGNGAAGGISNAETTVTIAQVIPRGDRLARATRVAELERDLAGWEFEATRIEIATTTARRFIDVMIARRNIELARQHLELAERVATIAARRVAAGDVPPRERTRAELNASSARLDLRGAEMSLQTTRSLLAAQWGEDEPGFERIEGNLERLLPLPSQRALLDVLSDNPTLARWATETARSRAQLLLAQALSKPDISLEGGLRHLGEDDDLAFVFGVSMPLMINDRNQGAIRAAQAELAGTAHRFNRDTRILRTVLIETHADLRAAHTEATTLRDGILPGAQSVYEATNRAYEQGQITWVEQMDAQQTLADANTRYAAALGAYHRAAVAIEGLIGRSLPALLQEDEAGPESRNEEP